MHGGGHLIGRLRFSVTTAPRPVRANPFPEHLKDSRLGCRSTQRRTKDRPCALLPQRAARQAACRLASSADCLCRRQRFYSGRQFQTRASSAPIYVLKRGELTNPANWLCPARSACVSTVPSRFELSDPNDEGARRAALAKWIIDSRNPLTWRSIVNRVGTITSVAGLSIARTILVAWAGSPTHPELLDWLAVTFLESGGSFKQLHRLIVTSATTGSLLSFL